MEYVGSDGKLRNTDELEAENKRLRTLLQAIFDGFDHDAEGGVKWLSELWVKELDKNAPALMRAIRSARTTMQESGDER